MNDLYAPIVGKEAAEKIIQLMGKQPLHPLGTCFESSIYEYFASRELEKAGHLKNFKLVHGVCVSNAPGSEGDVIAHAWHEYDCESSPGVWVRVGFDPIWGQCSLVEEVRKGLQVTYAVEYSYEEIKKNMFADDNINLGPWDAKIKEMSKADVIKRMDEMGLPVDPKMRS